MTDPAQAFLNHGNVDQTAATAVVDWGDSSSWVGAKPPTGIGIALLEGSWPELDAAAIDPATGLPQVDGYTGIAKNCCNHRPVPTCPTCLLGADGQATLDLGASA